MLKKYVARSEQLELNKKCSEEERYCNFLCQKYLPVSDFYVKQAGKNMCINCTHKLILVKKYIKDGRITQEQFKENPDILDKFKEVPKIEGTLECVECRETKNLCQFDANRNICKKCRKTQVDDRSKKRIEDDINTLEEHKDNPEALKNALKRIPVNIIQTILKHYGILRSSTDKRDDTVAKIIDYFKKLQDPYKCLGNCGFTLEKEFSHCNKCQTVQKISVEEKNHLFKENLPDFMDGLYELTEEHMYTYNDFCIRAIAEYLGITMFKTKVKGNTKAKMIQIINEALAKKKEEETKSMEQKPPDLELNGIVMLCREDGYIDATKLCQAGGKKFNDWYRLEQTNDLIQALNLKTGIDAIKLIDSKKGRYGGSWIHPDLAVQLAQWISPMFSLQVSSWVREIALTGGVMLMHEKTSDELIELQKNYRKLESNHNKLLEKRQYHKFKLGSVFYIISDNESNRVKFKPGFKGVDINVRLAQHRSTSPGIRLEFLVYGGLADCKLLETGILKRYEGKREHKNHEWVYDVDKVIIMSGAMTLLKFLGIKYEKEEDIEKYNVDIG